MCEAMLELFPEAHVYYLGLFREKVTLQPVECRNSFLSFAPMLNALTNAPFRLLKTTKAAYC